MFSLWKLLHKEDRLLPLLETSALEARASMEAPAVASQNLSAPAAVDAAGFSRRRERQNTMEIDRCRDAGNIVARIGLKHS